jgi:hypothetical protein
VAVRGLLGPAALRRTASLAGWRCRPGRAWVDFRLSSFSFARSRADLAHREDHLHFAQSEAQNIASPRDRISRSAGARADESYGDDSMTPAGRHGATGSRRTHSSVLSAVDESHRVRRSWAWSRPGPAMALARRAPFYGRAAARPAIAPATRRSCGGAVLPRRRLPSHDDGAALDASPQTANAGLIPSFEITV